MGAVRDVIGVARCSAMAAGIVSLLRYICFDSKKLIRSFDDVVAPLLARTVGADRRTYDVLLASSIKFGLAMWGYAEMACLPFDAELVVLGSSFTRVYDDLVDNFDQPALDDRVAEMFGTGRFEPLSDVESLLLALYQSMETRLARPRDDPIYAAVKELHRYERQSRRQCDPDISPAEVRQITRDKGGYGLVALFALLRPAMVDAERELLMDLGEVIQLLDDHHDVALDRKAGVRTSTILGESTLAQLARKIRGLHGRLGGYYGRARVRGLAAALYLVLVGALFADRDTVHDRATQRRRTTFALLFAPAGNLVR
ncbi:MAG TPA: class 1 isoprenoid biosynthesis enzyme [Pseudonocardiaceae bacterium]|nr:class 1 isoprenoid biosynthesis enzyme [Pseudonocardiaceae bacterium]